MANNITITIDDKELVSAVNRVMKTVKDAKPLMQETAVIMQGDIQDHFHRQMGPKEKWTPSKRALGQGTGKGKTKTGTTLRDTGFMFNSLMAKSALTSANTFASVGTDVKYAPTHNFGLTLKNRGSGTTKMPQREFIWLSPRAIKEIIANFAEKIGKAWKG